MGGGWLQKGIHPSRGLVGGGGVGWDDYPGGRGVCPSDPSRGNSLHGVFRGMKGGT